MALFPGQRGLQSPSQLVPESRLNAGMRSWPRLNINDSINQGLVGSWSMNGGTISGTTVADLSGNANNGTMTNTPTTVNGLFGQAMKFASPQYVNVPLSASLEVDYLSIMAWAYHTVTGTYEMILCRDGGGSNRCYSFGHRDSGDAQYLALWNNSSSLIEAIGATLPLNVWFHTGFTFDGSNVIWYLNGVQVSVSAFSGTVKKNIVTPLNIGQKNDGSITWQGPVQDLRMYNRPLLPSEVQRLYSDITGNLGLNAPTRSIAATLPPPPPPPPPPPSGHKLLPLLGGAIAAKAAHMALSNPRPRRRDVLLLRGK